MSDGNSRAHLQFLVESAQDLNSSLRFEEALTKVAARVKPLIDYHLFCLMLWNEETSLLEHGLSRCLDEHVPQKDGFALGHGISGSCAAERRPIRVGDVASDTRYVRHPHAEVEIRSEIAVPLIARDRLVGVLDLESTEPDAFTQEHENTLVALASHIATALENARLHEEVLRDEQRLMREMNMARQIQKSLLPVRAPAIRELGVGLGYLPAERLGGDFYDFLMSGRGQLALAIGDVAGKATPAALYGSMAIGIMRGHSLGATPDPKDMLQHLNDGLLKSRIDNRYLALAFAVYDGVTRTLSVANAGFPMPHLVREHEVLRIDVRGIPLGILDQVQYEIRCLEMRPGDLIVFCSDGIEECVGKDGRELGHDRLAEVLQRFAGDPAQKVADRLLEFTDEFAGDQPQNDDRTVVVLRQKD